MRWIEISDLLYDMGCSRWNMFVSWHASSHSFSNVVFEAKFYSFGCSVILSGKSWILNTSHRFCLPGTTQYIWHSSLITDNTHCQPLFSDNTKLFVLYCIYCCGFTNNTRIFTNYDPEIDQSIIIMIICNNSDNNII